MSEVLQSSHLQEGEVVNLALWAKAFNKLDFVMNQLIIFKSVLVYEACETNAESLVDGLSEEDALSLLVVALNWLSDMFFSSYNKDCFNSIDVLIKLLWAENDEVACAAVRALYTLSCFPPCHRHVFAHESDRVLESPFAAHPNYMEQLLDVVSAGGSFLLTPAQVLNFESSSIGSAHRVLSPSFAPRNFTDTYPDMKFPFTQRLELLRREGREKNPLHASLLPLDDDCGEGILVLDDVLASPLTLREISALRPRLGVQPGHLLSLLWRVRWQRLQTSRLGALTVLTTLYRAVAVMANSPADGVNERLSNFFRPLHNLQADLLNLLAHSLAAPVFNSDVNEAAAVEDLLLTVRRCLAVLLNRVDDRTTRAGQPVKSVIEPFASLPAALGLSRARGAERLARWADGQTGPLLPTLLRHDLRAARTQLDEWLTPSGSAEERKRSMVAVRRCEETLFMVVTAAGLSGCQAVLRAEGLFTEATALLTHSAHTFPQQLARRELLFSALLEFGSESQEMAMHTAVVSGWLRVESFLAQVLEMGASEDSPECSAAALSLTLRRLDQEARAASAVDLRCADLSVPQPAVLVALRDQSRNLLVNYLALLLAQLGDCDGSEAAELAMQPAFTSTLSLLLELSSRWRFGAQLLQHCLAVTMAMVECDPAMPAVLAHFAAAGLVRTVLQAGAAPALTHNADSLCELLDFVDTLGLCPATTSLVESTPWPSAALSIFQQRRYLSCGAPLLLSDAPRSLGGRMEELMRHFSAVVPLCVAASLEALHMSTLSLLSCPQTICASDQQLLAQQRAASASSGDLAAMHCADALLSCVEALLTHQRFRVDFLAKGGVHSLLALLKASAGSTAYLVASSAGVGGISSPAGYPPVADGVSTLLHNLLPSVAATAESLTDVKSVAGALPVFLGEQLDGINRILHDGAAAFKAFTRSPHSAWRGICSECISASGSAPLWYAQLHTLLKHCVALSHGLRMLASLPAGASLYVSTFAPASSSPMAALLGGSLLRQLLEELAVAETCESFSALDTSFRPRCFRLLVVEGELQLRCRLESTQEDEHQLIDWTEPLVGGTLLAQFAVTVASYFHEEKPRAGDAGLQWLQLNDTYYRVTLDAAPATTSGYHRQKYSAGALAPAYPDGVFGWLRAHGDSSLPVNLELLAVTEEESVSTPHAGPGSQEDFLRCFEPVLADCVYSTSDSGRAAFGSRAALIGALRVLKNRVFLVVERLVLLPNPVAAVRETFTLQALLSTCIETTRVLCEPFASSHMDLSHSDSVAVAESCTRLLTAARGLQVYAALMGMSAGKIVNNFADMLAFNRYIVLLDESLVVLCVRASTNILRCALPSVSLNSDTHAALLLRQESALAMTPYSGVAFTDHLLDFARHSVSESKNILTQQTPLPSLALAPELRLICEIASQLDDILLNPRLHTLPQSVVEQVIGMASRTLECLLESARTVPTLPTESGLVEFCEATFPVHWDLLQSATALATTDHQVRNLLLVQTDSGSFKKLSPMRDAVRAGSFTLLRVHAAVATSHLMLGPNLENESELRQQYRSLLMAHVQKVHSEIDSMTAAGPQLLQSLLLACVRLVESAPADGIPHFWRHNPSLQLDLRMRGLGSQEVLQNLLAAMPVRSDSGDVWTTRLVVRHALPALARAFWGHAMTRDSEEHSRYVLLVAVLARAGEAAASLQAEAAKLDGHLRLRNLLVALHVLMLQRGEDLVVALTVLPTAVALQATLVQLLVRATDALKNGEFVNTVLHQHQWMQLALQLLLSLSRRRLVHPKRLLSAPAMQLVVTLGMRLCERGCRPGEHSAFVGLLRRRELFEMLLSGASDALLELRQEYSPVEREAEDALAAAFPVRDSTAGMEVSDALDSSTPSFGYYVSTSAAESWREELLIVCGSLLVLVEAKSIATALAAPSLLVNTISAVRCARICRALDTIDAAKLPWHLEAPLSPAQETHQLCLELLCALPAAEGAVDEQLVRVVEQVLSMRARLPGRSVLVARLLIRCRETRARLDQRMRDLLRRAPAVDPHSIALGLVPAWAQLAAQREPSVFVTALRAVTAERQAGGHAATTEKPILLSQDEPFFLRHLLIAVERIVTDLISDGAEHSVAREDRGRRLAELMLVLAELPHRLPLAEGRALAARLVLDTGCLKESGAGSLSLAAFLLSTVVLPQSAISSSLEFPTPPSLSSAPVQASLAVCHLLLSLLSLPGGEGLAYRRQLFGLIAGTVAGAVACCVEVDSLVPSPDVSSSPFRAAVAREKERYALHCTLAVADLLDCLTAPYSPGSDIFLPSLDECCAALAVLRVHLQLLTLQAFAAARAGSQLGREATLRLTRPLRYILWVGVPLATALCERRRMLGSKELFLSSLVANDDAIKAITNASAREADAAWSELQDTAKKVGNHLELVAWWSPLSVVQLLNLCRTRTLEPTEDLYDFEARWERGSQLSYGEVPVFGAESGFPLNQFSALYTVPTATNPTPPVRSLPAATSNPEVAEDTILSVFQSIFGPSPAQRSGSRSNRNRRTSGDITLDDESIVSAAGGDGDAAPGEGESNMKKAEWIEKQTGEDEENFDFDDDDGDDTGDDKQEEEEEEVEKEETEEGGEDEWEDIDEVSSSGDGTADSMPALRLSDTRHTVAINTDEKENANGVAVVADKFAEVDESKVDAADLDEVEEVDADGTEEYGEGEGEDEDEDEIEEDYNYEGTEGYGEEEEEEEDEDEDEFDANETDAFSCSDSSLLATGTDVNAPPTSQCVGVRFFGWRSLGACPFYFSSLSDKQSRLREDLDSTLPLAIQKLDDTVRGPISETLHVAPTLALMAQFISSSAALGEYISQDPMQILNCDSYGAHSGETEYMSARHWGVDASIMEPTNSSVFVQALDEFSKAPLAVEQPDSDGVLAAPSQPILPLMGYYLIRDPAVPVTTPLVATILTTIDYVLSSRAEPVTSRAMALLPLYAVDEDSIFKRGNFFETADFPILRQLRDQLLVAPLSDLEHSVSALLAAARSDSAAVKQSLRMLSAQDNPCFSLQGAAKGVVFDVSEGALALLLQALFQALTSDHFNPSNMLSTRGPCDSDGEGATMLDRLLALCSQPAMTANQRSLSRVLRLAVTACLGTLQKTDGANDSDDRAVRILSGSSYLLDNPVLLMPEVRPAVIHVLCKLATGQLWHCEALQRPLEKVLLYLAHCPPHFAAIVRSCRTLSRSLLLLLEQDMAAMTERLAELSGEMELGNDSTAQLKLEARLNQEQCPESGLRFLQLCRLLSRATENVSGVLAQQSEKDTKVDAVVASLDCSRLTARRLLRRYQGDVEKVKMTSPYEVKRTAEMDNEPQSEMAVRDLLRAALAQAACSMAWVHLVDCIDLARSLLLSLKPPAIPSPAPSPTAVSVQSPSAKSPATDSAKTSVSNQSPVPSNGSADSPPDEPTLPPVLRRLFPLVECCCCVLGACLLRQAEPVSASAPEATPTALASSKTADEMAATAVAAGPLSLAPATPARYLPHSNSSVMGTRGKSEGGTPAGPIERVASLSVSSYPFATQLSPERVSVGSVSSVGSPLPLMRQFSLPDAKFQSGGPIRGLRSVRLDQEGLQRFLQQPVEAESLDEATAFVQTGQRHLVRPPPDLVRQFIEFVDRAGPLLNGLLASDVRLLEGSLRVLRLAPECRKQLSFSVKRRYFELRIERLKRAIALEDEEELTRERVLGIANFYSEYHTRQRRRESGLGEQGVSLDQDITVEVDRARLLHSSFEALADVTPAELLAGRFSVSFGDEEGIDEGGLTREWLALLIKELFLPQYALFTRTSEGGLAYQPNPQSGANSEHLDYFRFAGRLVGKAIVEGYLLDAHFTRPFYKHMLGAPVGFSDLKEVDEEFYKNLSMILTRPLEELGLDGSLSFSVEEQRFGEVAVVDLVPGGRSIQVTDANKADYARWVAHHRMTASFRPQIEAFLEGFHQCVPSDTISIFDAPELELLISGLPDIDVEDLRVHTQYAGYTATDDTVRALWSVLRGFSKEEKALFLQFVTGTSKVPLGGFAALQGIDGTQKFCLTKSYGDVSQLPTAHTCFNQLDLPDYRSETTLRDKMLLAIKECSEGFGFA